MDMSLKNKIDLMISNRNEINNIKLSGGYERYFMAMYLSAQNVVADAEKIKVVKKYISDNTGIFSAFKGESKYLLSTILSNEKQYELFFDKIKLVYKKLKDTGFSGNSYLTISAYIITHKCAEAEYDRVISRTKSVFDIMKTTHPILTNSADYALATIIGILEVDPQEITNKIEQLYKILSESRKWFDSKNHLQTVCCILAISDKTVKELVQDFLAVRESLDSSKIRIHSDCYTSMATLAVLSNNINEDVTEIIDGYEYLKGIKGYGSFAISTSMRFLIISGLLLSKYEDNLVQVASEATNLISLLITQHTIACSAAVSATTASSSSS